MTILGELPITEGKINVKGRIAYVSQQPWEFSATLRQNITLGNYFVQDKYERIIKACALNKVYKLCVLLTTASYLLLACF